MSNSNLRSILILVALTLIIGLPKISDPVGSPLPFHTGEKLTFQVRWAFIPAGKVVLEILPVEEVNGVRSLHFLLTARTYSYLDPFYKVRDRIESYTDLEMTHSILYKKYQQDNPNERVVVNFDYDSLTAQYSKSGERRNPISILPGSFDPLSVFYAFRLHDLRENAVIERPVTDGKRSVIGRARVVKRQKVVLESGSYNTYLVEPDLEHIAGVFDKAKDAKVRIWVTADKRRIPVRIKSKVKVGSFVAELVSFESAT